MLSCKEASRLASRAMDGNLPPPQRLALGLHLAMCAACKEYRAQLRRLRQAIAAGMRLLDEGDLLAEVALTAEEKREMAQALAAAGTDSG